MSFDEHEIRKALDARGGEASPEFRARLKQPAVEGMASRNWMPLIAATTVVALTMTSLGVLVAARRFNHPGTAASGARVGAPSPSASPSPAPATVQLSAPSTNVVWALVNYDHLYRSTDQGGHWEQRPMPSSFGVRPSVSFINDHEGWLLAPGSPTTQCEEAQAAVWHTVDAGTAWTPVLAGGIGTAQCKDLIYFSDSNHGWVTAWDQNHQPTVYWTDRGTVWKKFTLPDPPDFKTVPGGFSLHVKWIKSFGRTTYLEAFGSQGPGTPYPDVHDRQYIFTSTDFGVTWAWKQKVPSRDMALVTESRWLEVLPRHPPQTNMDESVNGGQQFHPMDSDLQVNASAADAQLVFADAMVGYATGGMYLQRTVDGGSHWVYVGLPGEVIPAASPSPSPSGIPMPTDAQLSAPLANVVWALVAGGYLFRSTDRATSWEQRNWVPYSGGGGNPVISFVDDTNGWALLPGVPSTQCQQAGAQLWRTSDAAATWQVVATVADTTYHPNGLPFEQCKEYMTFVNSSNGFVAGHDTSSGPIISRTTDGGVTWVQSTLPDPAGFVTQGGNAFQVVDIKSFGNDLLGLASTGNGLSYVYRSADGGATWTAWIKVPSVSERMAFVTQTRWLFIGNDGSGQETTDAGKSWHGWSCDYKDAAGVASRFVFADANVGYGTVRGGVRATADGGSHWKLIKTSWP